MPSEVETFADVENGMYDYIVYTYIHIYYIFIYLCIYIYKCLCVCVSRAWRLPVLYEKFLFSSKVVVLNKINVPWVAYASPPPVFYYKVLRSSFFCMLW